MEQTAYCFKDFNYVRKKQGIEITKYNGFSEIVTIPSMIEGLPVIQLGKNVFAGFKNLKKLVLNDNLQVFDENCIQYPLRNNAKIERIFIPASVKKFKLSSNRYGAYGGLVKYTISEENPNFFIDDDICYSTNKNKQLTVLFCQNKRMRHAVINDGTVSISKYAFSVPYAEYSFGKEELAYMKYLEKVDFPDSLQAIEKKAFANCRALKEISIGKSVSKIGENVFFDCPALEKITVSPDNKDFAEIDGVVFDKTQKNLLIYPEGRKAENYEIPPKTEYFGQAFSNVSSIDNLILSENIREISKYAFSKSCGIKTLYIKNDITDIHPCAFGEEDWYPRTRISPIEIHVDNSFRFEKYLQEEMKSPRGNVYLINEADTPEMIKFKRMFAFKKVEDGICITKFLEPIGYEPDVIIPATFGDLPVVELGDNMFRWAWGCGIKTLIISEGIKRIGESVLFGYEGLTKIQLPASVEKISPWVFAKNKEFKDLYLSDSLEIVVEAGSCADQFLATYDYEYHLPRIVRNNALPDNSNLIIESNDHPAMLQKELDPTDRNADPLTILKERGMFGLIKKITENNQ